MAHPDHDQVIGRLVGGRLRGAAGRPDAAAAAAHPDAETWAAYVDGGLPAGEVRHLDEHLAGCAACRRLVGALAPEVSAAPGTATRDAQPSPDGRAAVLPFPRRQVFAWMWIAAALFMAVTLWSVSRLGGDGPVSEMAGGVPTAEPLVPAPAASAPGNGQAGRVASVPRHETAAPAGPTATASSSRNRFARTEQDKATAPPADALAKRATTGGPAERGRTGAGSAARAQTPAPAAAEARDTVAAAAPAEEQRLADARSAEAPASAARRINQQTSAPVPASSAPEAARSAPATTTRERGAIAAFSATAHTAAAPPVFAEPGGRLQWRIVDGRRLESSSDGGVTWTVRPIPRGARLRAGAAPAIDAAWAVGDRGLVLRLSVPGGWAAVTPPAPVTLVAVSATDGRSARVTAADGQVFDTVDGGATWTPATPGARPQ